MPTYVALLRGINVSGHHLIKMDDLKQSLSKIDLHNIITYRQSGNVVFSTSKKDIAQLEKEIENQIHLDFGFRIPTMVIEKDSFIKNYKEIPFLTDEDIDLKKIYLVFLSKTAKQDDFNKIDLLGNFPEKLVLKDDLIYAYYINGLGTSKLNNTVFEKNLKVKATIRNYNTVSKIKDILSKSDELA